MKTIMITGSTDGIGLATAEELARQGHRLILHGRTPSKLVAAREAVESQRSGSVVAAFEADLSNLSAVDELASSVRALGEPVDVLVNNAGVYKTTSPMTSDGLDVRFVVNTFAPYLLTQRLMSGLSADARIVNLSSAAQAPVNLEAMAGRVRLDDMEAYAQSKLAITMWSKHLSEQFGAGGPVMIAVNPGSLLATNMVQEGWGIQGNDISIGVDILVRASISDEFADATGSYFDNDSRQFANPHPDALDRSKNAAVVAEIERLIAARG